MLILSIPKNPKTFFFFFTVLFLHKQKQNKWEEGGGGMFRLWRRSLEIVYLDYDENCYKKKQSLFC